MTLVSKGALAGSSFNPSCSWTVVTRTGGSPGSASSPGDPFSTAIQGEIVCRSEAGFVEDRPTGVVSGLAVDQLLQCGVGGDNPDAEVSQAGHPEDGVRFWACAKNDGSIGPKMLGGAACGASRCGA